MIIEVIGEVLMPKYLAMVINNAAAGGPWYSVGVMGMMILTALLMMAGGVGGSYFGAKASVYFASDLRRDIYAKVQTFSFSNIDKFSTGSLVTRLTNDVTQMQNFIATLLRMCLRSPGILIGALIMAITLRPKLSLVLAVSIPMLVISILVIVLKGFPRFGKMQGKVDGLNNTVQENVTNVRVVKSFVREERETEKFKAANTDLKETGMSAMKIMIFLSPVMTLFMNLTVIAILWFGGKMVLQDENAMLPGDLSAFITYCTQILQSLMMVTMMLVMSSRAMASAKRIREVLYEEPDIDDQNALCRHGLRGCHEDILLDQLQTDLALLIIRVGAAGPWRNAARDQLRCCLRYKQNPVSFFGKCILYPAQCCCFTSARAACNNDLSNLHRKTPYLSVLHPFSQLSPDISLYHVYTCLKTSFPYPGDIAARIKCVFYYSRKKSYTVIRKKQEDLSTKDKGGIHYEEDQCIFPLPVRNLWPQSLR
jgi:ABC-type multidrug transport system fused ATPase/permease subunit